MRNITFRVNGDTQPQGRPRATRMGKGVRMYDDPKSVAYKTIVRASFNRLGVKEFLEGPLYMKVVIYKKMPKAFSKKKQQMALDGILRPETKPDVDNYAKTFMDALNGLAYKDDSQVVTLVTEKYYSDDPHAFIEIQTL